MENFGKKMVKIELFISQILQNIVVHPTCPSLHVQILHESGKVVPFSYLFPLWTHAVHESDEQSFSVQDTFPFLHEHVLQVSGKDLKLSIS